MTMTPASLARSVAKFVIPALALFAFNGFLASAMAQPAADGRVTIAMRVASTPASDDSNVTVVPKSSGSKINAVQFFPDVRDAIHSTIRSQLKALAKGDASLAFANLTPQTQRHFAEPQRFMRSVATDAPPIVKTRSFAFIGLEQDTGGTVQQVLLTDEDGRSWLAKFQVEQHLTGEWRVKSCVLEALPGQQA